MAVRALDDHHVVGEEKCAACTQHNSFKPQTSATKVQHAHTVPTTQLIDKRIITSSNNRAQVDSVSFLPSYVIESPHPVETRSHCESLIESTRLDGAEEDVQEMNTPDELASTQQLSQSIYDNIILRSKSVCIPDDVQDQATKYAYSTETQHTLNEGDDGHIDITSSFITHHDPPQYMEDMEDSESVGFSPPQSQQNLTQFPESQRFKTPATAGKKRNYKGDTIETPSLPRNPLARNGAPTPSRLMGLSQAFADTQAVSSPLSNGLPTAFRSDRPSPNIDMQTKVANISSSPLRLLPNVQRAVTEPSTRYIPMKQSQAERERQLRTERENEVDDNDSDDFEKDSSSTRRRRREKERDQKIRNQLCDRSSPSSPFLTSPIITRGGIMSSPMKPSEHSSVVRAATPPGTDGITATSLSKILGPEPDSELETEQEDEDGINVRRSSQTPQTGDENKENQVKFVQDTVVQLQRVINGSVSQVEASPCIRYSSKLPPRSAMHSSEPLRIADSQPSQPYRNAGSSKPTTSSGTDVIDFVNQGSHPERSTTRFMNEKQTSLMTPYDKANGAAVNQTLISDPPINGSIVDANTGNSRDISNHKNGTAAATDSEPINGSNKMTNRTDIVGETVSADDASKLISTQTHHSSQPVGVSSSQPSSQPVVRTPARRRRRLLLDLSTNNSPQTLTPSFNAAHALQLDPDEDMAGFLEASPNHTVTYSHKRRRVGDNTVLKAELRHSTEKGIDSITSPTSNSNLTTTIQDELDLEDAPEMSQEIIQPTRKGRLARSNLSHRNPEPSSSPRRSIWEPDPSPMKAAVTKTVEVKKSSLKKRGKSRLEERIQPNLSTTTPNVIDTTINIDNDSPDPLAVAPIESEMMSSTPEILSDNVTCPNMVFAFFNGNLRAYYPAVYLGHAGSSAMKYRIQWEGYAPDEIDAYGVKALDLRVGDVVKINLKQFPKVPYIIRGFKDKLENKEDTLTDIRGYRTLIITPKPRKTIPSRLTVESWKEVPISAIYLDSQMWQQMKNRNFDFAQRINNNRASSTTPAETIYTPDTPTSRHKRHVPFSVVESPLVSRGMFTNMAFAISYESLARKNTLVDLVQANGGLVLENSFHDLLESEKVELKPRFANIGFSALLTERHSRKEKYMHALALGLPCLSGRWIEACVQHQSIVDWQTYLLPAGESEELEGATRSRLLSSMDPCTVRLSELLEKRVNLLHNVAVIIVVGRGKADVKRAPYVFLIQALGAGTIYKVPDIKAAQEAVKVDPSYGYVFVDDKDLDAARTLFANDQAGRSSSTKLKVIQGRPSKVINDAKNDCTIAGNELIVQSLILGRLYKC